MIRRQLKKTTKHPKIIDFLHKYNIPTAYFSANRKMISRGVLLGIFIAFIPMPMQMAAVVLFTPFWKFNVPIAIAMCWVTNPLSMPPIYYVEYLTGSFILGMDIAPVELTMEWFSDNISKIFVPLYVGAFFYSIVGSLGGYYLVRILWKRSVNKERNLKK